MLIQPICIQFTYLIFLVAGKKDAVKKTNNSSFMSLILRFDYSIQFNDDNDEEERRIWIVK